MTAKMMRYTHADFADDDSVNSVQLTEAISTSATHVRYQTASGMWQTRSTLERALFVLVGTLLFVTLVLATILHSTEHKFAAKQELPCLEESCVHIASKILEAMNTSVDPCDDFYAYACDGWIKNNPIPDGKSSWGTFAKLEQQNQLVIKNVLEKPIDRFKSKAEQKAKMYYESCLDVNDTIEKRGAEPMNKLIRHLGGWSITETGFSVEGWNFQSVLQKVQNYYSVGALFSYAVGEDDRNSTRHVLQMDQSGLSLPTRDFYLNKSEHSNVIEAYKDYMTKIGTLLGGEINNTREQVEKIVEFETRLAAITTSIDQRRDEESLYNNMTIKILQSKAPFIQWREFFEDALKFCYKVTPTERIVVYAPEYLGNLTLLIKEYQNTTQGKITLNNYLVWQTVRNFVFCLPKRFRDAYKGLRKALLGDGGEEAQWRYCVQDTNNVLGFAVGAMFVREVFHSDSKIRAEEMINNVRVAFLDNFRNLEWMDEDTRKAAVIKADAISDMIGYPEFIKDTNELDKRYENLTIRNDSYFDNNINVNLFNLRRNLQKINEPVNKTTWVMPPSTVNAYYTPTKNQMVIPAGILQKPYYDPSYPASLNYGGMGVVMGHELIHAFDDQGREFDKDGNLHKWWKNETIYRFKNRTQCFVQQYSKYKVDGKNINGNQTLGENIADNGGLKAAYHAYLRIVRDKPQPNKLPGIPLTHKQLFFVAFAQVWCSVVSKEANGLHIEKDTHSPVKYRVIGSLSNLREFSEEFKCKRGQYMNPKKKCEVW